MLGYIFCLKNTAIPAQVIKITKPLTNNKHLRVLYFWSVSNFEFGFRNTLAPLCVLVLHPVQWILLTTYHVFARKTKCTFLLVILHFIMTMGPFFVFFTKAPEHWIELEFDWSYLFSFDLIFYCPNKKYKRTYKRKFNLGCHSFPRNITFY